MLFMNKTLNLKQMKRFNKSWRKSTLNVIVAFVGFLFLCTSCEFGTDQDTTLTYSNDAELSITEYIESNPERFSILYDILDTTGLNHLFRTYGDYTFLAPTDSAFEAFFIEEGKSSVGDFEKEDLIELIKYHVFNIRMTSGSFVAGIIEDKTLSSDYMVASRSLDGSDVVLNKSSKIVLKNEILANGIIHAVDKVLSKPDISIYDWLKENQADYSIFIEALEKTGLNTMFDQSDIESEDFYTCFITPDSKYIESNINSFDDLVQLISPDNSNYSDSTNLLWSFIGSHFIDDVVSMVDATEDQAYFGTISGATMKFGIQPNTANVILNYFTSDFPNGLDIDEFNSNNLVANGIIHLMDTIYLIPSQFIRSNLLFIWMDVPGFPYDSLFYANGEHWDNGEWTDATDPLFRYYPTHAQANHMDFAATNGWLTLNAPYSGFVKFDHHRKNEWNTPQALIFNEPMPAFLTWEKCDDLLDITRKLPYIIPGKYLLSHYTKTGLERPAVIHYFDDEPIGGIINLTTGNNALSLIKLGVVEIEEGSTEHFFRVQALTTGNGFHAAIKMEPVD